MIKIDISKADEYTGTDYEQPFPQGWHTFQVERVEVKTSKSSGTQYIQLTLNCSKLKRKLWHNLYVQSDSAYIQSKNRNFFDCIDTTVSEQFDEQLMVGSVFVGKVKNTEETYNGEQKIKSEIVSYKNVNGNGNDNASYTKEEDPLPF